jgi:hypothetical protein
MEYKFGMQRYQPDTPKNQGQRESEEEKKRIIKRGSEPEMRD